MKYGHIFFPVLFGALFGLGLGFSGMMMPQKVQGFLDIVGNWDASLLWVLGGAVGTTILLFPIVLEKDKPIYAEFFSLPTNKSIDRRLLLGAAIFGAGWAITGMCPGPALANVLSFNPEIVLFVFVMFLAFFLVEKSKI